MNLSSWKTETVPLPPTVESRTKMLNIPLGIIAILVWNISLNLIFCIH